MSGQNHPVRQETGGSEGIAIRGLDHAVKSHAREPLDLGETTGVVMTIEPGDDVPMAPQGRQDFGRIPSIITADGGDGVMGEHDDLEAATCCVRRDAFEPRELLGSDGAVPILRLREFARLDAGEFCDRLLTRLGAGERRIRAHGTGVQDDETEARAIEVTVARGDAESGVDLRFLPVQQGEIVIPEDMLPTVARRGERRQDRVVAPPLAVDGVAEIDAEIERAGVEIFDRGAELGDRRAIRARASVRDVRILRIGDDADLEAFAPRGAADERRDGDAERELTQEPTAGQRRSHVLD